MAGLQTILNYCNGLNIDRRKVVGIQYTRNEIPRVSQTPTKNPWKFTLDMPNKFKYYQARDLMEALDKLDRITPEVITFSNLPSLSWIFKYQGALNQTQLNALTVSSFVGNQLILGGLPAVGSGTVLFEPNDLIQIGSTGVNPYPFTSTTQVLRGGGSTVTVTTNRPNIITGSVTGQGIIVGNTCEFNMFCPNMPTYKLVVGGQAMSGSTVISNALLEFSDSFNLYEFVGDA
jgi:hypothetical protein